MIAILPVKVGDHFDYLMADMSSMTVGGPQHLEGLAKKYTLFVSNFLKAVHSKT